MSVTFIKSAIVVWHRRILVAAQGLWLPARCRFRMQLAP
jgi:hypothetical protein